MGSYGLFTMTLTNLPPLLPNDFMFEKYADKGATKPEIFAWVANDIMARVAGLPKISLSIKDKRLYKEFMTGKIDEMEHSGKKFTAKPMPSIFPCLRKKKRAPKPSTEADAKPADAAPIKTETAPIKAEVAPQAATPIPVKVEAAKFEAEEDHTFERSGTVVADAPPNIETDRAETPEETKELVAEEPEKTAAEKKLD